MQEKELPAGEYKMIIVNDPRKEETNLKVKVKNGEFTGLTIDMEMLNN